MGKYRSYRSRNNTKNSRMNKALTAEQIIEDSGRFDNCRDFYSNLDKVKEFGNTCNVNSFKYLWGLEEGNRLWLLYVSHANRNIYKFLFTYLTSDQKTELVGNLLYNNDNLKMVSYL